MLETERSSGTLRVRSDNLELVFHHRGDRWIHELLVRQGDRWQWLIRSIEGAADDPIPPSPPLQDLRLEQLGEELFEFQGMGQAGGAIYSAAIRVDPAHREIFFDLCLRGKRADSLLQPQSTYEVTNEATAFNPMGPCLTLTAALAQLQAIPEQIEAQPLGACRHTTREGTHRITVACSPIETCGAGLRPRTVRWGYRLRLVGLP